MSVQVTSAHLSPVDNALTAAQRDDLRTIAGMMIPESAEYKVPGADDATIQVDILATMGRDTPMVRAALDHLARLASRPLALLDDASRAALAMEFSASGGAAAATLIRVILQCYYRDDRVASEHRPWTNRPGLRLAGSAAGGAGLLRPRPRRRHGPSLHGGGCLRPGSVGIGIAASGRGGGSSVPCAGAFGTDRP